MGSDKYGASGSSQFQPAIVKFVKGSFFVVEGKVDTDRFFIVQEGRVQITREVDKVTGDKDSFAGPGDIIAAVSVMAGFSYIETAIAATDVIALAVEKKQYSSLIRANTPIAMRIIQQFSQRLRTLDEMMSRLTLNRAAASNPTHLLQVAEYYASQRKPGQAIYAYQQYIAHCPQAENLEEIKQKITRLGVGVKIQKPEYPPEKMERTYPVSSLLFAEGENGHEMFFIQEGSVKISKIVNNQEVVLAILRKGDIFGEMALLEDKPRAATAEAYEDCTLLAVNRSNFEGLIKTSPEIVARLTTIMAERIWLMYRQLSNTVIQDPLGRVYDALLIQLEKERVAVNTNQPHMCNFGFKELADIARIPQKDHESLLRKLFMTKRITLVNNKIYVTDPSEVLRQSEYNRRSPRSSAASSMG